MNARAIALAISLAAPELSESTANAYAAALVDAPDPLLAVALVDEESEWRASAVSPDGGAIGLGQIRWGLLPPCRTDKASAECAEEQNRLREPIHNLRITVRTLKEGNDRCKRHHHRETVRLCTISIYGGMTIAQAAKSKRVRLILRERARLARAVSAASKRSRPKNLTSSRSAMRSRVFVRKASRARKGRFSLGLRWIASKMVAW